MLVNVSSVMPYIGCDRGEDRVSVRCRDGSKPRWFGATVNGSNKHRLRG
ncbi:hypothetical protein HanIR_Chr15g0736841 [Helianthus annuus]|nr:hypothetical protein HanIR_Chr15g0736841 [Helianthus annuus]